MSKSEQNSLYKIHKKELKNKNFAKLLKKIFHSLCAMTVQGWDSRRIQLCPSQRWTQERAVVRLKLQGLKTSKNARTSEHERRKIRTWTYEIRCRKETLVKAGKSNKRFPERLTMSVILNAILNMSARKSEHERMNVWWTHKSPNMNARNSGERTNV